MKISKLSIIIPAYNEADTIELILGKLDHCAIRADIEKEIIVVDDGSTDGTREILEKYKNRYKIIFHERNQGKGAAVRTGFERATGDYLIVQDADLEYNPDDIQTLIDKAEATGAKVVYGSRVLGKDRDRTPGKIYQAGGRFLTLITNLLYHTKITDEPTCYKMFDRKILGEITLESNGFEFCPEITAKTAKAGYKIEEVPISYAPRSAAQGKKIKIFKDGFRAVWTLIKYKFR